MSLKQSIVIVNEFTVKTRSGGGSRGKTPGRYVLEYMGRNNATEDLTPVRLQDQDSYIKRYMARESATEQAGSVQDVKSGIKKADGLSGRAFGYGQTSLSHEGLMAASKDIQAQFDKGKTVMKTVLSFEEEYLREAGIIDEDFQLLKAGDYRGNIDQMKLRMAIMSGLDKMSKDYDDLRYVGVIQVDTKHVHCHLAMVDAGEGQLAPDGTQKGKISENAKKRLRRGIDMYLDENQQVRQMSSNVTHDRRNALCFIKKFTHRAMEQEGEAQFLMACLPDDKRLWRAGSNAKSMQKANYITREYVNAVLKQPDSGYPEVLRSIDAYARGRQEREGLSDAEYRQLYRDGQERVITDCMNGVYSILKQVPDEERTVRTPMLHAMSMPYTDMAAQAESDPMVEFGFKLRSYSSRIDHHRKETHKYRDMKESYRATQNVSPDSKPVLDFAEFEEDYNAKLMAKYQHFLAFLPPDDAYRKEFDELMDYRDRVGGYRKLLRDPSAKRMTADNAEDYGEKVYGVHGGRFVVTAPRIANRRLATMESTYRSREASFRDKLADYGMSLQTSETGVAVSRDRPYDFDEVKALDLHHLGYDFSYDVPISKVNIDKFVEAADTRYELYQSARRYLIQSGQADKVDLLPGKDVKLMADMADRLRSDPVLPSVRPNTGGKGHKSRTVKLDPSYREAIDLTIRATIEGVQLGE